MTLTTVQGLIAMSMGRPVEPVSVESLLTRGINTEGTGIRWAEWVDVVKVLGEGDEGSAVTTRAFFMGGRSMHRVRCVRVRFAGAQCRGSTILLLMGCPQTYGVGHVYPTLKEIMIQKLGRGSRFVLILLDIVDKQDFIAILDSEEWEMVAIRQSNSAHNIRLPYCMDTFENCLEG